MTNERIIPSDTSKTVVTFTLFSDGEEVSREHHVLSIVVAHEINRIPSATILLLDGEASRQTFHISESDVFEPGKEIEIKAGYSSDEESIFKGIVVRQSIKVRNNNSVLVVECRDKAVKMTGSPKSNYYSEVKDSEIIEELINSHNLSASVEATEYKHKSIIQYESTDWDFMLCRCDAAGVLLNVRDGEVTVSKPDFSQETSLTVMYGASVLDLDAEMDARTQFSSYKGRSWDYTSQELLKDVEASDPGLAQAGEPSADVLASVVGEDAFSFAHAGKLEEPELKSWADSKSLRQQLARIRGRVKTTGIATVNPGNLIEMKGVGERFEGKLFVSAVKHEIQHGSWTTNFQFGLNPEWFADQYNVRQPLAGGLLPPVEGLQIGVVTQLQEDPAGENRIMVRLPMIDEAHEGAWYRVATLDAGKDRGSFFLPEVGDEVLVGFLNNDPRHGVVMGMLNSSKNPAPLEAKDDNDEKGFQTRSKMKLMFDDKKKSILLETPAGNKVLISEDEKVIHLEDQNGNKLIMDSDGITIESSKKITIKAGADLKMEGSSGELKASGQVKIEGSGGAELSSSGVTNVKGSMVNIN